MEYANADPTFATKTNVRVFTVLLGIYKLTFNQALSISHPMTRVMKGDGNCGWRGKYFDLIA